ncbi:MAG: GAF domain-containing protein [Holophagales bacterium]|nr:GAF domain-containing protein [Holophagales bacterium]
MRTDESAISEGTDRYRRQRRIQEATYAIAQAVTSSEGLDDLFARIHRIVAGLMEARNLYIALLDEATGSLTFPYFRDEIDAEPPGPVPVGRGLTGYVLRKGEPLLASPEVFDDLVARGEVESIGAASIDWLGVPLRAGDRTIGVLAVQSYVGNLRYGAEDQALLGFVSSQVALAIERRRGEEALRQSETAAPRAPGGAARPPLRPRPGRPLPRGPRREAGDSRRTARDPPRQRDPHGPAPGGGGGLDGCDRPLPRG